MKQLFAISILLFAISCNKSSIEPNVSFPISLYYENVTEKTKIRLFVNKKEVTDATQISNYVKRNTFTSVNDYNFKNLKITFVKKDSLLFLSDPTKYYYKNDGGIFTITTPYNVKVKESDFKNAVMLFPYQKTPIIGSSNFDFSANEFLIGRGNYDLFSLSIVAFKLKSRISQNSIFEQFGGLYNEFNENAISKLTSTDTLLVQEFKMNFKSK